MCICTVVWYACMYIPVSHKTFLILLEGVQYHKTCWGCFSYMLFSQTHCATIRWMRDFMIQQTLYWKYVCIFDRSRGGPELCWGRPRYLNTTCITPLLTKLVLMMLTRVCVLGYPVCAWGVLCMWHCSHGLEICHPIWQFGSFVLFFITYSCMRKRTDILET